MGDKYSHEHSVSSETIIEAVVNGALGTSNAGHDHHSHTVTDSQGNQGHGSGNDRASAESAAWDNLKK